MKDVARGKVKHAPGTLSVEEEWANDDRGCMEDPTDPASMLERHCVASALNHASNLQVQAAYLKECPTWQPPPPRLEPNMLPMRLKDGASSIPCICMKEFQGSDAEKGGFVVERGADRNPNPNPNPEPETPHKNSNPNSNSNPNPNPKPLIQTQQRNHNPNSDRKARRSMR